MTMQKKLYKKSKSSIHSSGLFASSDIENGLKIIEYRGLKVTKAQSDNIADIHIDANKKEGNIGAVYIFTLNKTHDINGKVSWNTAKFINHSCDPNCEVDIVRGKIWISSIKDIKKNEELTYDYGYDMHSFEEHPCRCGSKNCLGYIVRSNLRWRVKKKLEEKKRKNLFK